MGTYQPKGEDHYMCREVKAERDRLRQRIKELEKVMVDLLEWVEPIAGDNQDKDDAANEERTVLAAKAAMDAEKQVKELEEILLDYKEEPI